MSRQLKGASPTPVAAAADVEGALANIIPEEDGEAGSRLIFSTRGDDGELSEKMRLTKDGALAVGTRVPPGYPRSAENGCLNVIVDDPSRPGAILMNNMHEAARGIGNTLGWGAATSPESDGWQLFINRRIGLHAFMLGTTHTTGATAGGMVLVGDSYHEYQGKGPVIKSPNGMAYRILVDDNGNRSTEKF